MAKVKEIKRRIKSIQTTKQITKAMEMVAAVKMRKAQEKALAARTYADTAWELLADTVERLETKDHSLLKPLKAGKALLLVIASDRGLCAGLNANLFRAVNKFVIEQTDINVDFIVVGRRGQDYFRRRSKNIIATFSKLDNLPHLVEVRPVAKVIFQEFKSGNYGKVFVAFNDFISTTSQKPLVRQLLPIEKKHAISLHAGVLREEAGTRESAGAYTATKSYQYAFEPAPEAVLEILVPRLTEMQIYQAVLEANASEHSARMIAMHNATQNSQELLQDLLFSYNQSRQENITREISEISSGAEAMRI